LNRKEALAVSIVILASLVGGVFASTSPASPSGGLTLQTTGVDIEVLKIVPGLSSGNPGYGLFVYNAGSSAQLNFTAGFSFGPVKGFTQVNSLLITVVYVGGASAENFNDAFSVQLNGQQVSNTIAITQFGANGESGITTAPGNTIHAGANTINIGIARGGTNASGYFLYEVRLTVEYTFLG